jgi:oxygen-dependent protoporphyrinogen oxidase
MREMELRHGGLVKAMISRQLEKRRSRNHKDATSKKSGGPGGPAGRLTSFKTGLDVLTQTMGARLNSVIKLNREVARIDRQENCWSICDKTGNAVRARQVVLACPTYNIAPMFADFDQVLSEAFNSFPYAPIIVMATGHRREDVSHPLDGFGFLIPRNQKLRTLGSIWTSSIFSERAPEGHVQFRSMFGGAGDPAVLELSDEQLWTTLKRELDPLVGIRNDPRFMRIYRWKRGIPQFTLGHRERRARLDRLLEKHPGLFVVGNAYSGVSLNECVKMAYKISEKIASLSIQNWV